jgi:hypothetical protein
MISFVLSGILSMKLPHLFNSEMSFGSLAQQAHPLPQPLILMRIYKILRLESHRKAPLECVVRTVDRSWDSLEEALNDLGRAGWKIETPIYRPVPGRGHEGETWLEALVLVKEVVDVEEIKEAVRQLSPEDLAAFRAWFFEFDASVWDRQIEEDVAAGRLDRLGEEALRDLREGRCSDL